MRAIRGPAVLILVVFAASVAGCNDQQSSSAEVERGRQIYSQSCMSCHGNAATGEGKIPEAANHGPSGHTWHHADQQLADIILGRLEYPDRKMPSFAGQLTEEQVRAVIAYFKTNWTPQQRAAQAEVTQNWEAQQREGLR